MLNTYTYPEYAYVPSDEQRSGLLRRHPVVIIGAGPIGLTQALDFAYRGIPAVILDDNNTVSIGSRAVCYAKRPLEIWDRLGVGAEFAAKGGRSARSSSATNWPTASTCCPKSITRCRQ
jgi:3-(3-hydroxy-phenyl)propionate hydroxylase